MNRAPHGPYIHGFVRKLFCAIDYSCLVWIAFEFRVLSTTVMNPNASAMIPCSHHHGQLNFSHVRTWGLLLSVQRVL
jgi:hypothetical protein